MNNTTGFLSNRRSQRSQSLQQDVQCRPHTGAGVLAPLYDIQRFFSPVEAIPSLIATNELAQFELKKKSLEQLRLNELRNQRQRAEEEAKLLSNRINLLYNEENKNLRTLDATKKKIIEISEAEERHLAEIKWKQYIKEVKQRDQAKKQKDVQNYKENQKAVRSMVYERILGKTKKEAQQLKGAKNYWDKKIEDFKLNELKRKQEQAQAVKQMEKESQQKKEKIDEWKILRSKLNYSEKVANELKLKEQREKILQELELRELTMIENYQNTQKEQKIKIDQLTTANQRLDENGKPFTFTPINNVFRVKCRRYTFSNPSKCTKTCIEKDFSCTAQNLKDYTLQSEFNE